MMTTIDAFLNAMLAAGIRPLEPIADKLQAGLLVRFRADGDKPGRRNGWARLYLDGLPAGAFGHHRLGIRNGWRAGSDTRLLSASERRAMVVQARQRQAQRTSEKKATQKAAAIVAQNQWRAANKPTRHKYLARKGLSPFGIRQLNDELLVPMFDRDFSLWNIQRIFPDGRKLFLSGGRIEGLFWPHGALRHDGNPSDGPLVIGEGFATMAAIHNATGLGVIAAMSACNLETVARSMRGLFPARLLIIAADDDRHLPENIGLKAAEVAALSVGARLAIPLPSTHNAASVAIDFADLKPGEITIRIAQATGTVHG